MELYWQNVVDRRIQEKEKYRLLVTNKLEQLGYKLLPEWSHKLENWYEWVRLLGIPQYLDEDSEGKS